MQKNYVIQKEIFDGPNCLQVQTLSRGGGWHVATAIPAKFKSPGEARQAFYAMGLRASRGIWIRGPKGGIYKL